MSRESLVASVGKPFTHALQATGGDRVFNRPLKNWTVVDGRLPAGLSLDPATGVISGSRPP